MGIDFLLTILPIVARFVPQLAPFIPLIQLIAPVFKKVNPQMVEPLAKSVIAVIGNHIEAGATAEEAIQNTTGDITALHAMTPEEEKQWFDRASMTFG